MEFIAALSEEDENDRSFNTRNGRFGDWSAIAGIRTADVTPSGRLAAFMSVQSITGYDNAGATEVFVYNAATNRVTCASCNPAGTPPAGLSALPVTNIGTDVPQWLSEKNGERLVFDSFDSLVPWDTNGRLDVYEYQNGQVSLISAGTGSYDSALATASSGAHDIFFTTSDRLVSQDPDELIDLYDAREGGGFPGTTPVEPCLDPAACRGGSAGGSSASVNPASSLLRGSGNVIPLVSPPKTAAQLRAARLKVALRRCKAKRRKQPRRTCERAARRRYGPPHSNKSRKGTK